MAVGSGTVDERGRGISTRQGGGAGVLNYGRMARIYLLFNRDM